MSKNNSFPVFSISETIKMEKKTIENISCASTLMEVAGQKVYEFIKQLLDKEVKTKIYILCGPGNNGGDGLIAARMLISDGMDVEVVINEIKSTSAKQAYDKLNAQCKIEKKTITYSKFGSVNFTNNCLIIDALYGTGISKNIDQETAGLIRKTEGKKIISIDIPSGINGDTGLIMGIAIVATYTITFDFLKKCHVLFPGMLNSGTVLIANIGILKSIKSNIFTNSTSLFSHKLPIVHCKSNKYTNGHLAIFGGNSYNTGAAILAASAAQNTSCGIVTICSDSQSAKSFAYKLVTIILKIIENEEDFLQFKNEKKISAFIIGPASGVTDRTKNFVLNAIKNAIPMIMDADAITVFEKNQALLKREINKNKLNTIMTPHESEFKRLFKSDKCKIESTRKAAKEFNSIIIHKGSDTIIAHPDGRVVINNSNSYGLSIAGSGDVLSGILGSLVSSGMPLWDAALAGTWIHSELGKNTKQILQIENMIKKIPKIISNLIK